MQDPSPGRVVMLDFDGVVADTLDRFCTATAAGFARLGRPDLASRERVLALLDDNWFAALEQAGLDADDRRVLDQAFQAALQPYEALPAFSGMPAAVARIADRQPVIIVTSTRGEVVTAFLSAHGVSGVREVIGADVERSKVRKIARVMAEHGPERRYWYVGDTVGDVVEGRRAGAVTVAVTWGWHSEERLRAAQPDHVVTTPDQLVALLAPGQG